MNRALRVADFAQHAVVHRTRIVKAPVGMPTAPAALLACGVITGLGAVVHTARFRCERSVVVISCGGVGLSTVQGAKLAGATKVIAVDIESFKLEAAGNPISHSETEREPSRASRLAEEIAPPGLLFRYGKTNGTMQ